MSAVIMHRRKMFVLFIIIFTSLMFHISPTSASIWDVTATSKSPEDYSDFTVRFDDADTNKVVDMEEFVSWSEGTFLGFDYDSLIALPHLWVDPIVLKSIPLGVKYWTFGRIDGELSPHYSEWTYTATMVPLPGAVWLLGSGLIGIVGFRRKKFKK